MRSLPFFTVLLLSALVLVWNYSFDDRDSRGSRFVSAAVRDGARGDTHAVLARTVAAADTEDRAASELVAIETGAARECLPQGAGDEPLSSTGSNVRRLGAMPLAGSDGVPEDWVHHVETYPGGARRAAGYRVEGMRVGHWVEWYEEGGLKSEGAYVNDEPDGDWVHHHKSGGLYLREAYRGGELAGPMARWDPDGALIEQGEYREGREVGEWVQWYSNGQVRSRGTFVDGKRTGSWVFHDYDGRQDIRTGTYTDGRCIDD